MTRPWLRPRSRTTCPTRWPRQRRRAKAPSQQAASRARPRPRRIRWQPRHRGQDPAGREVEVQVRRLPREPRGGHLHDPRRLRRRRPKPATGGTPGPVHNQIPAPDRNWDGSATDDNSTYWAPDFNRDALHGPDVRRGRVVQGLLPQAVQRALPAKGDVTDWVKVPFNEARYGSNNVADADGYWPFVKDTAHRLVRLADRGRQDRRRDQGLPRAVRQGATATTSTATATSTSPTATSTTSRRSTPVRAKRPAAAPRARTRSGRTAGTPTPTDAGTTGPTGNKAGGVPIGDTGIWIGDYTTEPENGGLGVFAHEFGHDLGLPDLYDTAGGDNGTGFWTLMSRRLVAEPRHRRHRHHARLHGPVGEAASSAGSTTTVVTYGKDMTVTLGPAGDTRRTSCRRRSSSRCPTSTVTTELQHAPLRQRTSGGAAAATTSTRR